MFVCLKGLASSKQTVKVQALKSKADAHFSLTDFFEKVAIPSRLISDNVPELTKGEFRRKARKAQCPMYQVEVDT